jgi:hypothetical protein
MRKRPAMPAPPSDTDGPGDAIWDPPKCLGKQRWQFSIDCSDAVQFLNRRGEDNFVKGYQTVRRLGQWLMCLLDPEVRARGESRGLSPGEWKWFWNSCLTDSTRARWENRAQGTENLTRLVNQVLAGYRVVRGCTPKVDPITRFTYTSDEGVERDIVSITWIAPSAIDAWNKANHTQLDGSHHWCAEARVRCKLGWHSTLPSFPPLSDKQGLTALSRGRGLLFIAFLRQ